MKPTNIINLNAVLSSRLHDQLVTWCRDSHWANYLNGSIYQYYPASIQFSKYHMYVKGECGQTIIIPTSDNSGYWEKVNQFHDELNKGACV